MCYGIYYLLLEIPSSAVNTLFVQECLVHVLQCHRCMGHSTAKYKDPKILGV